MITQQIQNFWNRLTGPRIPSRDVRVGAVSYLNTKPLIHDFASASATFENSNRADVTDAYRTTAYRLVLDVPSRLASQLKTGEIQVGLVPIIEVFRNPNWKLISNACIACDGPVWSVKILFRKPPEQIETLALDEGSRTSAVLGQILLAERFGVRPKTRTLDLHENFVQNDADAVLVIGDRAMRDFDVLRQLSESHGNRRSTMMPFWCEWDLGKEWLEQTGLPFVFAAWAANEDSIEGHRSLVDILHGCRDSGLSNVASIAACNAAKYGLTEQQCIDYLSNKLKFHLTERAQEGMQLYRSYAEKWGLLSSHRKTN